MKDLLDLILKNITTHPDDVVIDTSTEDGRDVFTITVHPEDMGRVIGKNGKVIQAIRNLAHVVAIRQGKRFRINIAETGDGGNSQEAPAAEPAQAEAAPQEAAEEGEIDLISGAIDIKDEQSEE